MKSIVPYRTGSPSGVIGHRRSDSGSSGQSLQSRNGEDFVSIDYASTRSGFVDVRHRRNVPTGQIDRSLIVDLL